ncbi:MAG: hypothetical protein AAF364_02750 [Pseudomonadota bacterium]
MAKPVLFSTKGFTSQALTHTLVSMASVLSLMFIGALQQSAWAVEVSDANQPPMRFAVKRMGG